MCPRSGGLDEALKEGEYGPMHVRIVSMCHDAGEASFAQETDLLKGAVECNAYQDESF